MLNIPFCMVISKKKFMRNNLLTMLRMTPTLFVALRNFSMVLSKFLRLGKLSWIAFFLKLSFLCHSNPNLCTKKVGNHLMIFVLYVDNLILTGINPKNFTHMKSNLKNKFEMIDLRHWHCFLGLQVLQTKEGIFLS